MVEGKGPGINRSEFGLKSKSLELIRKVFRQHPEVCKVKIFGSRATTHFEEYSDVDLALWGDLDLGLVGRILRELDELPLPYKFDAKAYDSIKHAPLKQHIDKVGKILYPGQ